MNNFNVGKYPLAIRKIRIDLEPTLPRSAFLPNTKLLYSYFLVFFVILALTISILSINKTAIQIVLSVLLGFTWTLALFYVHLFIHGHIVKNKTVQNILSLPCAYFGMISPTWWGYWHRLHHRFGTYDENVSGFQTINWVHTPWLNKIINRMKPSQNKVSSFVYLFFWKAIAFSINQIFFLGHPRFPKQINRRNVFLELAILVFAHGLIIFNLNWKLIILLEIIPWAIQNFLSSIFVVTNHHPKLINSGYTFQNTCSVEMKFAWMNSVFMNIGYHTEHHIFPECSPKYLPKLSKILQEKYDHKPIKLFKALRIIFTNTSA
jgi:fatty acid desaturase